jgi:hypothetical protein
MKGKNLFILKRSAWETWSLKLGDPDRVVSRGLVGERAGPSRHQRVNSSGASIGAGEGGNFEAFRWTSAACF